MAHAGLERADGFQTAFLEGGADAHDLAGRLHLGAEGVGRVGEFIKGEARELRDDVVERRLDRRRTACDRDLLQRHAHGDLRGDAGDRITGSLRSERRRAGDSGVDLDEVVFGRIRIQRELDVAAAVDLQLADDLDRAVVEHLQILVVQR